MPQYHKSGYSPASNDSRLWSCAMHVTNAHGDMSFFKWFGKFPRLNLPTLTAFFTVDSAAMTQAAETLAARVPNGTHLNKPALPNPRPLSLAKNHLIHTPGGPTKQANHSWAPLLPLLNSSLNSAPNAPHNKPSIKINTTMTAKWRLKLFTLQLQLELEVPLPVHAFRLVRSHLKPLAVSIPKIMA